VITSFYLIHMRKTGFKNAFRYLKATWKLYVFKSSKDCYGCLRGFHCGVQIHCTCRQVCMVLYVNLSVKMTTIWYWFLKNGLITKKKKTMASYHATVLTTNHNIVQLTERRKYRTVLTFHFGVHCSCHLQSTPYAETSNRFDTRSEISDSHIKWVKSE
jgi:hypothetical protein